MRHRYIHATAISLALCSLCACGNRTLIDEEPEPGAHPTTGIGAGTNRSENIEQYFTEQSTVEDVLDDPAFGDFARLLFPVDRNVSPALTLAQVSTSNIYMVSLYPGLKNRGNTQLSPYSGQKR